MRNVAFEQYVLGTLCVLSAKKGYKVYMLSPSHRSDNAFSRQGASCARAQQLANAPAYGRP